MARASQLKRVNGRLVSAKSKTGNPECSSAMSTWVKTRKAGNTPAAVFATLGKCRAQARQNKGAVAKQESGKLAPGRGTWQRSERAAAILAKRGPRPSAVPLRQFSDRVHDAVSAVPKSKRVGSLVWTHHAHAEYQKKHGPIPLDEFKANLSKSVQARHLDMSRADMVEAFDPADVNASSIKHMGGNFNFIRVSPPTAPISGGDHGAMPSAPLSMRERIAHQRLAQDLTGATRKRAAGKLKKARGKVQAATKDRGSHTNHEPGEVVNLKTDLIHFDPQRFQYKQAQTDLKTGSVGSLAGVKRFDPDLAGTVQVWKDPADGRTYVVNGHNRLELARKLGADRLSVRFLGAANAEQARSIGAVTNIAEGRGTALDAAKFYRDTGHTRETLEARGVPMREKIATDGLALSQLESGLFRRTIDGSIPLERAAIIGGSGLAHEQQKALVDLVDKLPKNREVTNATLRELTDTVKSAGSKSTTTKSLFGDEEDDVSLALHRATLQSQIKSRLSREKKLFGTVAKSKAAEDLARAGNKIDTEESGKISHEAAVALGGFDALKNRSGAVSRALNEASERIHNGENARKVTDETYKRILKDLPEMLSGRAAFAS